VQNGSASAGPDPAADERCGGFDIGHGAGAGDAGARNSWTPAGDGLVGGRLRE